MTFGHFLDLALSDTAPQVAFIIGLLTVIYKLGALWIMEYFKRITPIQERQVAATERLANSAQQFAENILREIRINSVATRGLWEEWEASKKFAHGAGGGQ